MNLRRVWTAVATLSFVFAAGAVTAGATVSSQAGVIIIHCVPTCDWEKNKDKDPDIDPWHDTGPKDKDD